MKMSAHALIRGQQRAVSQKIIDLIMQFGTPQAKPGNVLEYKILKRDKAEIIASLKRLIQQMNKSGNKAVLVSEDGERVITTYNLY